MNKQASGEDRISALPDDVICNILSNLYVEESARTSILSKRWRNMWLFSPIIISDESIVKQSCMYCRIEEESSSPIFIPKECLCCFTKEESSSPTIKSFVEQSCMRCFTEVESSSWIVNAMSCIIFSHPGSIPTCHFILPDWYNYLETLKNLLKALTLKGIRNLLINVDLEVPSFVFKCDSLVNVHLKYCSMPTQLPARKDFFPNLRKLSLIHCNINNGLLVDLISSRPIIELKIKRCSDLKELVIESQSLERLYFGCYGYCELTIKDALNLETFKYDNFESYSSVVILNAPKLKVLDRIDMRMSELQLGNYQFDISYRGRYMKIRGEITYMPSLHSLDIAVHFNRAYELRSVPHLLMCFPCLETLEVHVKDRPSVDDDEIYFDEYLWDSNAHVTDAAAIVICNDYDGYVHLLSDINCLSHHLKNVRVSNYPGRNAHLDFVKLITANAKALETLTIVYGDEFEERRIKSQKHFLMQDRASKMLQMEFIKSK